MVQSSTRLSLTNLSRNLNTTPIECNKALRKHGWLDINGHPTRSALEAGAAAASTKEETTACNKAIWNIGVCKHLLEKNVSPPINNNLEIEQWTNLLEALEEGSPSINTTAEEMARDLPQNLISGVNDQLKIRGRTSFRVSTQLAI